MAGLTSTGFEIKTLAQLQTELETELRALLGPALDLSADSVLGQVVGVTASKLAELWEVAQATYAASYPDSASGAALDALCFLTGVVRLSATASRLTAVALNGTNGTVIPAGSVITTPAGARFTLDATRTISGGSVLGSFTAEQTGPTPYASPSTLTIATPIAGWASATSATDAVLGRAVETDAALRTRRQLLLSRSGSATVNAIRADLLAVPGINECFVFENTSAVVDVDGVPGHAFEAVIDDDGLVDDDLIAQTIFEAKSAGILAHGADSGVATDSQGFDHGIDFTRASTVDVQTSVVVDVVADDFPADGVAQIKATLAAHVDALLLGKDVFRAKLFAPVFGVSGVQDVTSLQLGLFPGVVGTGNVSISPRKKASLDVAQVAVTVNFVSAT